MDRNLVTKMETLGMKTTPGGVQIGMVVIGLMQTTAEPMIGPFRSGSILPKV